MGFFLIIDFEVIPMTQRGRNRKPTAIRILPRLCKMERSRRIYNIQKVSGIMNRLYYYPGKKRSSVICLE